MCSIIVLEEEKRIECRYPHPHSTIVVDAAKARPNEADSGQTMCTLERSIGGREIVNIEHDNCTKSIQV